ncbi:unnamed protein product [Rotaria magnacalcarata]|uniref:DDE-1 domain-containing protein n=1 Tax=Rotaria magnacalcarata TaxID=392030 RepID=A0A816LM97_9BILA|nr:unnamed protein product [Rotaria magnacalcarata]CAF1654571.1 unnamed protein product [Rotaria magnacalcarata]CAF1931768.1 unnamed protein product [Rotaria magnacalcarata]CAF4087713.1 unnamed protein product [Rotaria magnacalcarata]CAF4094741.1 unnamed protein product [Rotaria magnacalcarata]
MPRTYIRKKTSTYAITDLKLALDLIGDGEITVIEASTAYNIPMPTLYSRLSGSRGGNPCGNKILSDGEEKFLIHVIHKFQEWQHPLTRSDFISIARTFMIEMNKKKITEDSLLREWFNGFQKRWFNEIKFVETSKLESVRSLSCTQLVVDRWFDHLNKVLAKLNLFDRPEAIYNVDESAFGDDPGRKQVIIKRDSKYAISSQGGSGKCYTTLLMCTSASGKFLPPYIIFRAQRLFDVWIPRNGYPGSRYNATPSGWSDENTFYDWLCNHFTPAVKMVKKPLLLIMDGHYSHLSTRIIKYCMNNGIHLECLPPHTTTILQPLDVLTLSKVKTSWRKLLQNHYKETNAEPVSKQKISNLFKNHLLPSHCAGGFSKAGVYPFDKRAISKEKLLQPATTLECDTSANRSQTTDHINDTTLATTNTSIFHRWSSCPTLCSNLSSDSINSTLLNNISFIHTLPRIISTESVAIDESIISTMINTSTINVLSPIYISSLDNISTSNETPTISNTDTSTSSLLFDTMKTLYPDFDQSPVSDPILFQNHPSSNTTELNDTFTQKPDINYNTNYSDSNDHNSFERETKYRIGSSTQPLSTVTHSETSDYSVVDAITVAIKNHMTPTVVATKGTKRKIDRPYGESITSIDAYMKIKKKETARVKRSNKENVQPKPKNTGTRQMKKKTLPENQVANNVYTNVQNVDQLALTNTSFEPYPQQISYNSSLKTTTSPTYTTMMNYNMSRSYVPGAYEDPMNWHLNEYRSCYKCNSTIHFNREQVSRCVTCDRICCTTCMYNNSYPMHAYFKCEYCALNAALHVTR